MKNRKGVILSGGLGTRLYPLTVTTSKQLLPVYNKPMIFYPLTTLIEGGIREIMLISTPHHIKMYEDLLGNGDRYGISIEYAIQQQPKGLAQALLIAKDFLDGSPSVLILGDNIFHGSELRTSLKKASKKIKGSTIFATKVTNPNEFGIVEFDKNNFVKKIVEKPQSPKSNYAVVGIYFYDKHAPMYAETIKPSDRGELEITSLNNIYLKRGNLTVSIMQSGDAWLDSGTHKSLFEASNYVKLVEERQAIQIGSPEIAALNNGWISKKKFKSEIQNLSGGYAEFLKNY